MNKINVPEVGSFIAGAFPFYRLGAVNWEQNSVNRGQI